MRHLVLAALNNARLTFADLKFINLPLLGVPASLAFGYVVCFRTRIALADNMPQLRRSLHDLRGRCIRLISFSSFAGVRATCSLLE